MTDRSPNRYAAIAVYHWCENAYKIVLGVRYSAFNNVSWTQLEENIIFFDAISSV